MAAPVLQSQLDAVGRERGPDIALKSDKLAVITNAKLLALGGHNYDVNQFNITEVLNVIAAISNTVRTAAAVDSKYSAHIPTCGGIVPATGVYAAAAVVQSLEEQTTAVTGVYGNILAAGGGLDGAVFDFDNLTSNVTVNIKLPQCLLKRTTSAGAANEANLILPSLELTPAESVKFIGDVFRQGFSILAKTRDVFGPKGWTALFSQVKGGGGTGKTHAKRTHRRHRRRYSSKQY